jgi:WD40 repeat protein
MPWHSATRWNLWWRRFPVRTERARQISLSDDETCRVWAFSSEDGVAEVTAVHKLSSAGVSVQFHRHYPQWMMVAESSGAIRIMDIETRSWITSLWSPEAMPVRSVDWSLLDPTMCVIDATTVDSILMPGFARLPITRGCFGNWLRASKVCYCPLHGIA